MRLIHTTLIGVALLSIPFAASASESLTAKLMQTTASGFGSVVGTVTITSGSKGALVSVNVAGLPAGEHGFHIHEKGSCAPGMVKDVMAPAGAAGGHFDPAHTGHHMGPDGGGHEGDLAHLMIGSDGKLSESFTVKSITDVKALKGHAVIIHAGGDNYSDTPKPLGGGGARIACGILN